jgi:hypothetical protein
VSTVPRHPNRWWFAPVIGLVVLFTAAAGLTARSIYRHPVTAGTAQHTVASTGATAIPANAEPGPTQVVLKADAGAYPLATDVQKLLQTLFDAINNKQYGTWRSVVTYSRRAQTSEQQWLRDYQSSADGSIEVYRIDTAAQNGLRVLLTFTSTQDPANAPDLKSRCVRWQAVFSLRNEGGDWKLDSGSSAQNQPC